MSKRNMFPGGNTSQGFVNYFEGIFPSWEVTKKLYILKGGPGVGKNTFMKRVGAVAEEKKMHVEYFHCASDDDSLDAVRIPALGLTILDGTAPHIIDPVYPGAVDQIWNLGNFLDEEALAKKREDVIHYSEENRFCYLKTFGYLHAAGALEKITTDIYAKAVDYKKLQSHVRNLFLSEHTRTSDGNFHFRKLFYSAFTPSGFIDYAPTSPTEELIFYLDGPAPVAAIYLNLVLQYATDNGYHGEVFYSPLLANHPLHLCINEMNLCLTTKKPEASSIQTISLSTFMDTTFLETQKSYLDFQAQQENILLEAAISSLKDSKNEHDKLEEIYNACIDFSQVTTFCNEKIQQIFR